MDHKEPQDHKVHKELLDLKVIQVHKVFQVDKVI